MNLVTKIRKFFGKPPYPENYFPWNEWEPMRDPITKECTCCYCKEARRGREKVKNG